MALLLLGIGSTEKPKLLSTGFFAATRKSRRARERKEDRDKERHLLSFSLQAPSLILTTLLYFVCNFSQNETAEIDVFSFVLP